MANFDIDNEKASDLVELLMTDTVRQVLSGQIQSEIFSQIFKKTTDSYNIDSLGWIAAGISSANYALAKMSTAARCGDYLELLSHAISKCSIDRGLWLEFGVFSGRSIRHIANARPNDTVFGFDSFEGLPETWRPGFEKGAFASNDLPTVPENVRLIKGWFDRSLPIFCDDNHGGTAAFIHVDCDLYSSTQTIFTFLKKMIRPGTVIVFDEYFNFPGWEAHEFKAFSEFCQSSHVSYQYVGVVPSHQQAAVKILAIDS